MISHTVAAIGKAVEYVSPGQTVVIACDQPLFTLAKTVEWAQKERTWEEKLEVMLGGLHIEQAALKAFGTWLAGSGWVEVLLQDKITTAGKKRNLNCAYITRTRYTQKETSETGIQEICEICSNGEEAEP